MRAPSRFGEIFGNANEILL
jgi:hypothetical protein